MSIRINTIEYGWESELNTMVANETSQSEPKRIHIPESSYTFNSVIGMLSHRYSTLGGNTSTVVSVQIDNHPTQSYNISAAITNTPEHHVLHHHIDVTEYFRTYFTSSNHNVKFYSSQTANTTTGRSWKLFATYEFEDSASNTSIKTVRIPINSITASTLTTSEVYLGNYTASIPALDTYLPESSKVYRDIFVEYHANDANTGTTNYNLRTKIDNGSQIVRYGVSQSLQSSAYYYDIQNLSGSIDTSTTHSIRVSSSTTGKFTGLCGILHVTYEYDYTGSSQIFNSLVISGTKSRILIPLDNAFFTFDTYAYKKVYVPETSSVSIRRSGLFLSLAGAVAANVSLATTTSSYTIYTLTAGTLQSGFNPVLHQLDGTGSNDVPITISPGWNEYRIYSKNANNSTDVHLGGLIYLNYVSSRVGAPLANNHTILKMHIDSAASTTNNYYIYTGSVILPTDYYINDIVNVNALFSGLQANVPLYKVYESVVYTGEGELVDSDSPAIIHSIGYQSDSRAEFMYIYSGIANLFKRYRNDLRNLLNIETNRSYGLRKITSSVIATDLQSTMQYVTYHSITFPVTGSISNYSGTGADIEVIGYDYDNGNKLFVTQSLSGGQIRYNWIDRDTNIILVAVTGSNRYASNVLPPDSGSHIIDIPTSTPSETPSEKSFTFIS